MSFENYQEQSQEKLEEELSKLPRGSRDYINKTIKVTKGKVVGMFNLGNYKPEGVKDKDFSLIKGKGFSCKVNSSIIEKVEAGKSEDGSREWGEYTRLKYELEITDDKQKGFLNRKVWKSYNLDSDVATGKNPKTPVQKLADVFFTLGLEFSDQDSLSTANEQFVNKLLTVSFNSFKGREGNDIQLHTVTGEAWTEAEATSAPSF